MADQQHGKGRPTGAGSEAAEGIHGAKGDRDEAAETSVGTGRPAGARKTGKPGSEPLDQSRTTEHRSGYGGSGGAPVTSSDKREDHSGSKGEDRSGAK